MYDMGLCYWHVQNFRNQIRKFDAEAQAVATAKIKEQAAAEFKAEQESMRTMSYLSKVRCGVA